MVPTKKTVNLKQMEKIDFFGKKEKEKRKKEKKKKILTKSEPRCVLSNVLIF